MKRCLVLLLVMLSEAAGIAAGPQPVAPFESSARLTADTEIDRLVLARLRQLEIPPALVCSDGVFVRRVYLDVIGTLPTALEASNFILDTRENKRAALIDQLLERDELADYWALKWGDLLRIKAEFPINLWPNAVQAYHHWVRDSIKQNLPYDQFARRLLTSSGSNFRVPPVNFYRAAQSKEPVTLAQTIALVFMGVRQENWTDQQWANIAVFFSRVGYKSTAEWKEEIVFFDSVTPPQGAAPDGTLHATFPDGATVTIQPDQDPRKVFADWLFASGNPWFARNIVNRVWCWLQGYGIINEPDDIRPDNPPGNPELLAYLQRELVLHDYDLKHIYRLILNSKTYQLSSIARQDTFAARANFAFYPVRPLGAEVLIDALCQISGTTEEYSSAIPEPFTFVPENQRSIALADGSISSPFLEMFGRPSRDTGLESERSNRPTDEQRLHMLNSSHIQRKIVQSTKLRSLIRGSRNPRQVMNRIYLTILSRLPTADELKTAQQYSQTGSARGQDALFDLVWALINSDEFLYRH